MPEISPDYVIDSRFRVIRILGSGGMGMVYQAEQVGLQRSVAIKVIKSSSAVDSEDLARFKQEADILSRLNHRNICLFLGYGLETSRGTPSPYIAMEYLEGPTLQSVLQREGPLPLPRLLNIIEQVSAALAHAHEKGVIHRDLKPANIFVLSRPEGDLVKVSDFGLAKLLRGSQSQKITKEGVTVGTPLYMSPEQVVGGEVDAKSDVYSLGCLLYECIFGKPPFFSAESAKIMLMHYLSELELPSEVPGGYPLPESLVDLLHRALAKSPDQRFANMDEFRSALTKCIPNDSSSARSETVLGKALGWLNSVVKRARRSHLSRGLFIVFGLLFCTVGLCIGLLTGRWAGVNRASVSPVEIEHELRIARDDKNASILAHNHWMRALSLSNELPDKRLRLQVLRPLAFDDGFISDKQKTDYVREFLALLEASGRGETADACTARMLLARSRYGAVDADESMRLLAKNIEIEDKQRELTEVWQIETLMDYSQLLRALNRHAEARALLGKYIPKVGVQRERSRLLAAYGSVCLELGQSDDALKALNDIFRLADSSILSTRWPLDDIATLALSVVWNEQRQGNMKEIDRIARHTQKLIPAVSGNKSASLLQSIDEAQGWAWFRMGDVDNAKKRLSESLQQARSRNDPAREGSACRYNLALTVVEGKIDDGKVYADRIREVLHILERKNMNDSGLAVTVMKNSLEFFELARRLSKLDAAGNGWTPEANELRVKASSLLGAITSPDAAIPLLSENLKQITPENISSKSRWMVETVLGLSFVYQAMGDPAATIKLLAPYEGNNSLDPRDAIDIDISLSKACSELVRRYYVKENGMKVASPAARLQVLKVGAMAVKAANDAIDVCQKNFPLCSERAPAIAELVAPCMPYFNMTVDLKECIKLYESAIACCLRNNTQKAQDLGMQLTTCLGDVYGWVHNLNASEACLNRAQTYFRSRKNKAMELAAMNTRVRVLINNKKNDEARRLCKQVLKEAQGSKDNAVIFERENAERLSQNLREP